MKIKLISLPSFIYIFTFFLFEHFSNSLWVPQRNFEINIIFILYEYVLFTFCFERLFNSFPTVLYKRQKGRFTAYLRSFLLGQEGPRCCVLSHSCPDNYCWKLLRRIQQAWVSCYFHNTFWQCTRKSTQCLLSKFLTTSVISQAREIRSKHFPIRMEQPRRIQTQSREFQNEFRIGGNLTLCIRVWICFPMGDWKVIWYCIRKCERQNNNVPKRKVFKYCFKIYFRLTKRINRLQLD